MKEWILSFYPNVAGFCFVLGFLLIAHSHNRKNYIKNLLKNGKMTEGKVVEIYKNPGSLFSKEEGVGFAPVVEYSTDSGNTLKHYSSNFQISPKYKVGQIVPLWYINYKSQREAALEDDTPGDLPGMLFKIGFASLLIATPMILTRISALF